MMVLLRGAAVPGKFSYNRDVRVNKQHKAMLKYCRSMLIYNPFLLVFTTKFRNLFTTFIHFVWSHIMESASEYIYSHNICVCFPISITVSPCFRCIALSGWVCSVLDWVNWPVSIWALNNDPTEAPLVSPSEYVSEMGFLMLKSK